MAKKKQRVKAIRSFFDKEAKKQREIDEEWEVIPERLRILRGENYHEMIYVEVINADSTEKSIGSDPVREESEKE